MSSSTWSLVRLPPVADADAVADDVVRWLMAEGVALPNGPAQPRNLLRGPACLDAVEYSEEDRIEYTFPSHPLAVASRRRRPIAELLPGGIDVVTGRSLHSPGANQEVPRCASCGTAIDDAAYGPFIDSWAVGVEPFVACRTCGASRLLGDWEGEPSVCVVGEVAVSFADWLPLRESFVTRLRARLGGRTRLVVAHW